jgi:hypothetical protein
MPGRPTQAERTERAARRGGEWLWLAALVLVVSMHFWFPHLRPGVPGDSYSTTEEGKKAFYMLLRDEGEKRGWRVQRTFSQLHQRVAGADTGELDGYRGLGNVLVLLGPKRNPRPAEWESLLKWVSEGGTLVVAARDADPALTIEPLAIRVRSLDDASDADWSADAPDVTQTDLIHEEVQADIYWQSGGFIDAPEAEPLIEYGGFVQAVVQEHGAGQVIVLATDFLFWNQSLAWEPDPGLPNYKPNAELAFFTLLATPSDAVQSHPVGAIYFDESLNASAVPKVVGLLLQPPLRSITIQALALIVLFAWWKNRRFGPIAPPPAAPRRDIVNHTDAVGVHCWKARGGSRMVGAYLNQLQQELKLGRLQGHEQQVLEPVARRLNRPVEVVRKLLEQAGRAAEVRKLDRRTAAELIRRLAMIRQAARPRG